MSFGNFDILKRHGIQEHKRTRKTTTRNLNDVLRDLKVEVSNLKCCICDEQISGVEILRKHLQEQHNIQFLEDYETGVYPFILESNRFECATCNQNFPNFHALSIHLNDHFKNHVCPHCGVAFAVLNRLKRHLKIHADKQKVKELNNYCTKCNLDLFTKEKYSQHVRETHSNVKRHRCPHCLERFVHYDLKRNHLAEKHGIKIDYPCNLCSLVFNTRGQRSDHINQIHTKMRNFACDVCSNTFFTKKALDEHKIKHGGARSFICQDCGKDYTRKRTLREHMRIHNNDRRFACPHCSQTFVQKCSMQSHIRTHHSNTDCK